MTRYEWLIRAIADEAVKAGEAKKRGDVEMEKFHTNAAAGLHKKLRKLSLDEAARIADINRKGGIAFVVTSGNEALELLRKNKCI